MGMEGWREKDICSVPVKNKERVGMGELIFLAFPAHFPHRHLYFQIKHGRLNRRPQDS